MKVILIKDVPNLGKADEIKEVADGYANNYLFKKNLALPVSKNNLTKTSAKQAKKEKEAERELTNEQILATKLDGYELELAEKVSDSGSLYAAVGAQKIAKILRGQGYEVDKKQIEIEPIKDVGKYDIKIKFSHGLEVEIKLTVLSQ